MAGKKKKGSVKKKGNSLSFWFVLLFLALAGVVLSSIYLSFRYSDVRAPSPIYEEIYSTEAEFKRKIRRVDRAIYESLYRSGTPEEDVSFLEVEPRRKKSQVWDFTQILIKYPKEGSATGLLRAISRKIESLERGIQFKSQRSDAGRLFCEIRVEGCLTHKLTLVYSPRREPAKKEKSRLAVIIDDCGYDRDAAIAFIRLGRPICLSVLPSAPHTGSISREASENGLELLVHLPMEPKDYPSVNPGPGVLLLGMTDDEIRRTLKEDISRVPGARGVNHHMGSSFTENREKMLVVLSELKRDGLFYVDSRTTSESVALDLARELGLPAAQRHVFLDNDLDPKAIEVQFDRLLSVARHSGAAIGIGHAHKETAEVLGKLFHKMGDDFEVVPVSSLIE